MNKELKLDHWDIKIPEINSVECPAEILEKYGTPPDHILPVCSISDTNQKEAVLHLFSYFEKEYRYDFDQNGQGIENDPNAVAFLWIEKNDSGKYFAVGACYFYIKTVKDDDVWFLMWTWFHPYERRKGHLEQAWKYFRTTFGDFYVEPPYSNALRSFLIKQEGNANWGYLKKAF